MYTYILMYERAYLCYVYVDELLTLVDQEW